MGLFNQTQRPYYYDHKSIKMYKKFIEKIDIRNKFIFIRNDFNVPVSADGDITDDTRITESLRTINYAVSQNAKIICASHLGRPKGQRDDKLTLKRVAEKLSELTGREVLFNGEITGPSIEKIKRPV